MVEIVREVLVREEAISTFNLLFGPGGEWSRILTTHANYRGTTLLHDLQHLNHYIIIDIWDKAKGQTVPIGNEIYSQLSARLESICQSVIALGVFRIRSEATVRPRPQPRYRN